MVETIVLALSLIPLAFSAATLFLGLKRKKSYRKYRSCFIFSGAFLALFAALSIYSFVGFNAGPANNFPTGIPSGPPPEPPGLPPGIIDVSEDNPKAVEFIGYTLESVECEGFCFSVGVMNVIRGDLEPDTDVVVNSREPVPVGIGLVVRIQGEKQGEIVVSEPMNIVGLGVLE